MNFKSIIGYLFGLTLLFYLNSCQQEIKTKASDTPVETTTITDQNNQSTTEVEWLNSIPVYKKFDAIEPLFSQTSDTTYVINFWATWCKPCIEELPYFENLHQKYANKKLRVILVSLDFPKQLKSKLLPFIEKHQLQSDVVVLTDPKQNDWIDRVSPEWEGAIPITVIYNAETRKFIGEQFADEAELNSLVESFL